MYLYNNKFDTANAGYYDTFLNLTGWSAIQITNMVHNPNGIMTDFIVNKIQFPVYQHYSTAGEGICDSSYTGYCSFSNLTYNQWLKGGVLYYPLDGMDYLPTSYQVFYNDYTIL